MEHISTWLQESTNTVQLNFRDRDGKVHKRYHRYKTLEKARYMFDIYRGNKPAIASLLRKEESND